MAVIAALIVAALCPRAWCRVVEVTVSQLPRFLDQDPINRAESGVFQRFAQLHPNIRLKGATGLRIEGSNQEMVPLMQIAGDISPDVLAVQFRHSDTYVRKGFLMPLDEYIARLDPADLARRVPPALRDVCYREGPDGRKHWYMLPTARMVRMLIYRQDSFVEAGLDPDRPPRTWEDLLEYCRKLSRPDKGKFGMVFSRGALAANDFANLVWSRGGDIVVKNERGEWIPSFNTPEVVDALYFYLRLNGEQWRAPNGKLYRGVAARDSVTHLGQLGYPYAIGFLYLGDRINMLQFDIPIRLCPMPYPEGMGRSSSEVNAQMFGIFAGVKDPEVARAAFDYIAFLDSDEANRMRTRAYVQTGYGRFVNPDLLTRYGYDYYPEAADADWVGVWRQAMMSGKPEPHGRNGQVIYRELARPIEQALNDKTALAALDRGDGRAVKRRLKEILDAAQADVEKRMFGLVPASVMSLRRKLTVVFLCAASLAFLAAGLYLFKLFRQNAPPQTPGYKRALTAYILLIPAVATVVVWQYWPLVKGTIIAFQDYSVIGRSPFVGIANFAEVLFDPGFRHSLYVTVVYTALYMSLGFLMPILLALLLSEVPRGKIVYRTMFYLPAVLSGLVVTFLWKSFYGPSGILNTLLGYVGINLTSNWLDVPVLAMVGVLLPVIWAGSGPGCLIYLAAFKTIPEELYEAAEIDGAGIRRKTWNITLPSIRMLIQINAIGAFIGAFMTSETIFAMTAGGPYTPYGTTEVVGLQLFYTAFTYLKFGVANAMAWILGFLLIGFTMLQLKNLSRVEFRGGR